MKIEEMKSKILSDVSSIKQVCDKAKQDLDEMHIASATDSINSISQLAEQIMILVKQEK